MLFFEIAKIALNSDVMSDLETVAHTCSGLPKGDHITPYDRQHLATYLSLLHAEGEGVSIEDMAREILGLDLDPAASRSIVEEHLARARWLAASGHKHLLGSETDIPG